MAIELISKKKILNVEKSPDEGDLIQADMLELLIDQAYRTTLLELGVSI